MKTMLIGCLISLIVGVLISTLIYKAKIIIAQNGNSKLLRFYWTLIQWVKIKQKNISIAGYFEEHGVSSIAIYGMKELGNLLYEELNGTQITVKYVIDKKADHIFSEVSLLKPDDDLDPVDMIVVTVLKNNEEIIDEMERQMECPVVALDKILNSYNID